MEPSDVGPKYGGHLPVTEVDRGAAMTLLEAARTHGYLSPDEYENRAVAIRSAAIRDDLRLVTRDLENVTYRPAAAWVPATTTGAKDSLLKVGFFSGTRLEGRWNAPPLLHCVGTFGGVAIDLTDAVWTSDEIVIDAYAVFGGVRVKVPAGVEVVDQTFAIFGGTSVRGTSSGNRRVIVKGLAAFGGIKVKGPRSGSI